MIHIWTLIKDSAAVIRHYNTSTMYTEVIEFKGIEWACTWLINDFSATPNYIKQVKDDKKE